MSAGRRGRSWTYPHLDLGEHPLPDGSPILRPSVRLSTVGGTDDWLGIVDSGSPISVADPTVLHIAGVDVESAVPVMEVPLGMGAAFQRVPVFVVELALVPPVDVDGMPLAWTLQLASHPAWRLPFSVLLGQRGWFDHFPTTIDADSTTVHLPITT